MSEIEDRRQRAREAAHDAWNNTVSPRQAVELAIETATRVQITDEALEALHREFDGDIYSPRALAAALAVLGFEVEQ